MKKTLFRVTLVTTFLVPTLCVAQIVGPRTLTMQDVVQLAQENSISAMNNRNGFVSSYWRFRSYKSELLPSLSLNASLGQFNRTLVALQDFNTGEIGYRANYNLSNSATLNLSQNIPWTGGMVSLSTNLQRLDQYSPSRLTTYYSQPIYLTYMQNLWGYNQYKWRKITEPKEYEIAKRQYIESMELLSQTTISLFWNCVGARENYERAQKSFDEGKAMFEAGQKRFEMGTITRDQLMQIEVRVLNDSLALSSSRVNLLTTMNRLCSYIGYQENTELNLVIDYNIPDITLNYDDVLERALENSSFRLNQEVQYIQADQNVEQARANRGLRVSLNAQFGMQNSASRLDEAFVQMRDQEVLGLQMNIPILDWGLGRGRVRMAQAQAQTTKNSLEQSMIDYRQDLFTQVMQFNDMGSECQIAKRVAQLADESYALALGNFGSGTMTMSQLDQLKEKRDSAWSTYLAKVAGFWNSYFGIRRTTLYDYISETDINAEFDNLIK